MLKSPIPQPGTFVKFIEVVSPPVWGVLAMAVVLVLLVVLDLFNPTPIVACQAGKTSDSGKTTSACANETYPCRLEAGKSVTVTIRSDSVRNYTGVILDACVPYTAQFVEKIEWRDHTHKVEEAKGFEFEKNWVGLPRFWWMKWLRPYPKGLWFQVVGHIKEKRDVFPVLDKNCPQQPYPFTHDEEGELVLLVNDVNYKNNHGIMRIKIHRPKQPLQLREASGARKETLESVNACPERSVGND